jgi:hypothetical protein
MLIVIANDLSEMSLLRLAGRIVQGDGSTVLLDVVLTRQHKQSILCLIWLRSIPQTLIDGNFRRFSTHWARDKGIEFKIANAKARQKCPRTYKTGLRVQLCSFNDLDSREFASPR